MKIKELRGRDSKELLRRLSEFKKEVTALRFQKATGQLTNTSQIRKARRTIARIKLLLSEQPKAS